MRPLTFRDPEDTSGTVLRAGRVEGTGLEDDTVVEVEIDGLGLVRNRLVDEKPEPRGAGEGRPGAAPRWIRPAGELRWADAPADD